MYQVHDLHDACNAITSLFDELKSERDDLREQVVEAEKTTDELNEALHEAVARIEELTYAAQAARKETTS